MRTLSNSSRVAIVLAGIAVGLMTLPPSAKACNEGGGWNSGGSRGGGGHRRHDPAADVPGAKQRWWGWEFPPMSTEELDQANRPSEPARRSFDEPPQRDNSPPQADGFRFPTYEQANALIDERNSIQDAVEALQRTQQQTANGSVALIQDRDGNLYPIKPDSAARAASLNAALDGSNDADAVSRLMAARVQAAQQQMLSDTIRGLQNKIRDINIQLGYNRYRPLP